MRVDLVERAFIFVTDVSASGFAAAAVVDAFALFFDGPGASSSSGFPSSSASCLRFRVRRPMVSSSGAAESWPAALPSSGSVSRGISVAGADVVVSLWAFFCSARFSFASRVVRRMNDAVVVSHFSACLLFF